MSNSVFAVQDIVYYLNTYHGPVDIHIVNLPSTVRQYYPKKRLALTLMVEANNKKTPPPALTGLIDREELKEHMVYNGKN